MVLLRLVGSDWGRHFLDLESTILDPRRDLAGKKKRIPHVHRADLKVQERWKRVDLRASKRFCLANPPLPPPPPPMSGQLLQRWHGDKDGHATIGRKWFTISIGTPRGTATSVFVQTPYGDRRSLYLWFRALGSLLHVEIGGKGREKMALHQQALSKLDQPWIP